MKIVDDAVANRQFTLILVLLFTVLGAMSFRSMPRSEDPIFDLPMVTVVAAFPGADPEVIEALVVDPIEEEIRELDDLEVLESTIEDGVAVISAEMLTGVDPDDAYDDVQTKVDGIRDEMPAELQTLDVVKPSLEDVTVLQLALVSPTPQYGLLGRAAEDAERILDRVPGVKRVETWAYPDPEVRVSLLHERLRELGISLDQVAAAIQTAGLDIPGGEVDAGVRRYNVRTSGDFESLNQIRDAIIPGVPGERLLRVGDVARVDMDFEDEDHRGRFNGQPAVFVTVIQRGGTNSFQVLDAVHATLPAVEAALPAGVAMETVFDQSESVGQRIGGFFDSLVQGIALVGLIMLVFLGWRPAVLVVITIPMAILFALARPPGVVVDTIDLYPEAPLGNAVKGLR